MDNLIKNKISDYKIRHLLRKFFSPDKIFMYSAKQKFLSDLTGEFNGYVRETEPSFQWRYAYALILIVIISFGSLITYADVKDVSANNPLYSLKRFGERVEIQVSNPERQLELHQEYLVRRLEEIKEVEASVKIQNPGPKKSNAPSPATNEVDAIKTNDRVEKLMNDFQDEADNSIDKAEKLNLRSEQKKNICKNILDRADDLVKGQRLKHINDRCKSFLSDQSN